MAPLDLPPPILASRSTMGWICADAREFGGQDVKVKEAWEIEVPVGLAPAERGPTEALTSGFQAEKNLCGLCVPAVKQSRPRRRGAHFAKATEGLWLVMRFFRPSRLDDF